MASEAVLKVIEEIQHNKKGGYVRVVEGAITLVMNIPGCPPHPDSLVSTLASALFLGLPGSGDLDESGRPKTFYSQLIHENCPRRAYYIESTRYGGCIKSTIIYVILSPSALSF
ncbi:MAG: hypothetical protein HY669_01235 [Chloroflexi bacterium]|nr:hypothetical protein [Chloroflexota bacterium]